MAEASATEVAAQRLAEIFKSPEVCIPNETSRANMIGFEQNRVIQDKVHPRKSHCRRSVEIRHPGTTGDHSGIGSSLQAYLRMALKLWD
jgi:hypothetical protein